MPEERPTTLGALRRAGVQVRPVREELRHNLLTALAEGRPLFPGVMGYEDTVIPQIENAILAGHDIILLGERGQAKSRIVRSLTALLDEWTPVLAGCELPENPYAPITERGRQLVAELGDDAPVEWMHRDDRFGEKLATPDITIADLIGEVDPIKVAEGRYLSDELTIHYGLVPRTNRGIFAINELPDLAERIQVGLLNVLEERDVQIRGYKVRLPLDVLVVATANPEDYTNRGRIITPLKDRYGSQIRTHYPRTLEAEVAIIEQEAVTDPAGRRALVPPYLPEIVAEITRQARRSPDVNQRSGVSVRASVANWEAVFANALRRAVRQGEPDVAPRLSDLEFIRPTLLGKVEFEMVEEGREEQVVDRLVQAATVSVFNRRASIAELDPVIEAFHDGLGVEVGHELPAAHYLELGRRVPALSTAARQLAESDDPQLIAAATELVLEGLHLNKRLNKDRVQGEAHYRA